MTFIRWAGWTTVIVGLIVFADSLVPPRPPQIIVGIGAGTALVGGLMLLLYERGPPLTAATVVKLTKGLAIVIAIPALGLAGFWTAWNLPQQPTSPSRASTPVAESR